jgi:hypothetical protein
MDADVDVGASESLAVPQLSDLSSPHQRVPFSVTPILILLLGTGGAWLSLAQELH